MIKLQILTSNDEIKREYEGESLDIKYDDFYYKGDKIVIDLGEDTFMNVQLDATLKESIVYVPEHVFTYEIPFDEKRKTYAPEAWVGDEHIIKVSVTDKKTLGTYRNLALNSADKRFAQGYYPHGRANFVTRDETVFEERNAIDGVIENTSHGRWPYQSWAGGAREDLDYYLFFGREVLIDKIVFYERGDFDNDHDTYWKSLVVCFSDGTFKPMTFEKTREAQVLELGEEKKVEWIHLTCFKQAVTPCSWAALTQIEVYGKDIVED